MAFKMKYNKKGFPFKQNGGDPPESKKKWWEKTRLHQYFLDKNKDKFPPHYTKEDIKFLEEQNEDVVRDEDKK